MNPVAVRRARPGDIPAIAALHVRAWRAAYRDILPEAKLDGLSVSEREAVWRRLLAEAEGSWSVLVAEDADGELVGLCASATPSRDEGAAATTAEIAALYVEPGRWRQGTGSALLRAELEELTQRGFREVTLWVLPENHNAIAFYGRFGFSVEDGVEKLEERSEHTVIRLRRDLPGGPA